MTDLVERVARAMAEADGGTPADTIFGDRPWWMEWVPESRAALAVIREALADIPPEAIRAMAIAVSEGARPMPDAARALAGVLFKENADD